MCAIPPCSNSVGYSACDPRRISCCRACSSRANSSTVTRCRSRVTAPRPKTSECCSGFCGGFPNRRRRGRRSASGAPCGRVPSPSHSPHAAPRRSRGRDDGGQKDDGQVDQPSDRPGCPAYFCPPSFCPGRIPVKALRTLLSAPPIEDRRRRSPDARLGRGMLGKGMSRPSYSLAHHSLARAGRRPRRNDRPSPTSRSPTS
jgi:hypothetical protein